MSHTILDGYYKSSSIFGVCNVICADMSRAALFVTPSSFDCVESAVVVGDVVWEKGGGYPNAVVSTVEANPFTTGGVADWDLCDNCSRLLMVVD